MAAQHGRAETIWLLQCDWEAGEIGSQTDGQAAVGGSKGGTTLARRQSVLGHAQGRCLPRKHHTPSTVTQELLRVCPDRDMSERCAKVNFDPDDLHIDRDGWAMEQGHRGNSTSMCSTTKSEIRLCHVGMIERMTNMRPNDRPKSRHTNCSPSPRRI